MTQQELDAIRDAKIAELEAKLAAANKALQSKSALRCKVSEKGGVSVYGLNSRWPITLYASQWAKLADYMPTVLTFIDVNRGSLATKDAE